MGLLDWLDEVAELVLEEVSEEVSDESSLDVTDESSELVSGDVSELDDSSELVLEEVSAELVSLEVSSSGGGGFSIKESSEPPWLSFTLLNTSSTESICSFVGF